MLQHDRIHYEFAKKSQIVFPYDYATKKLKKYIPNKIELLDLEPYPIDLNEYCSINEYDENKNKKQCVIAIMGHVDHGKTTLLDTIRNTNIVQLESGAITQCVSCYHYQISSRNQITLIDTPGHEIFFKMRSNSVIIADAVVLVIDIIEGVQKQTIEIIKKAKESSIPLLLVLNKIDKIMDHSEISRNIQQFLCNNKKLNSIINNINLELKDVIKSLAFDMVPISAKYNLNIDQLLFSLDVLSNTVELISPYDVDPQGIVLEASIDNFGTYIVLIIHAGMLKNNMILVGGYIAGKIRCMQDPTNNNEINVAYPGMAAKCYITKFNDISKYDGINQLPQSGEVMYVMNKSNASQLLQYRMMVDDLYRAIDKNKSDLRYINDHKEIDDIKHENDEINQAIILKCDSIGSLNVLKQIIYETQCNENSDRVKIIEYGLGNVTVNDLELQQEINCQQDNDDECIIYMFNVDLSNSAIRYYQKLMKQEYLEDTISLRKAKYLFDTDHTIKKFNVFTDLQNDVHDWLRYPNDN